MFEFLKKTFSRKPKEQEKSFSPTDVGYQTIVSSHPYPGAWQQNMVATAEDKNQYPPVFACQTLIASDISKLGLHVVNRDSDGIYQRANDSNRVESLLGTPNAYQTTQQFIESWVLSKTSRGNAYIYKEMRSGEVVSLHVLHPDRVRTMVTPSGDVFYQLGQDDLAGTEPIMVPYEQIIHDRYNCLYHPLWGLSPIVAAATSVLQGSKIQEMSAGFFANSARPGGILAAPGAISDDTAKRLRDQWTERYSGNGAGKIAVVGDGLKFEPIAMSATDSQLVEQLRWSGEVVCSVFHVPSYKVGIGALPSYNNIQALNSEYYSQCLQTHITSIQNLLKKSLFLQSQQSVRFDLDSLLLMDTETQVDVLTKAVGGGFMRPNDAAKKLNQRPVTGGDTFYMQQQNYSLEALSKRDNAEDPFKVATPEPTTESEEEQEDEALDETQDTEEQEELNDEERSIIDALIYKGLNEKS